MARPDASQTVGLAINSRWIWHAAMILTVASWAAGGVVGRHVAHDIPPMTLALIRNGVAALMALGINAALFREPVARPRRREWLPLAALSVVGVLLQLPIFHLALSYTTATRGMLIWSIAPVFVALLAAFLLRERLSRMQWGGVALATGGIVLLLVLDPGPEGALVGDLLSVVTAAAMAAFILMTRRLVTTFSALAMALHVSVIGSVMILPFSLWEIVRGELTARAGSHLWAILFLALVTGGSRWLWNIGVARLGAVEAAAFMYLQPVLTAIMAYLFIGEAITPPLVAGGALVLLGTYCVQSTARPRG